MDTMLIFALLNFYILCIRTEGNNFTFCLAFSISYVFVEIYKEVVVNFGQNLTVPCPIHKANDVMWVKETTAEHSKEVEPSHMDMEVLQDGSLFLENVTRNDSGIYVCNRENVVHNEIKARVKVEVKSKYTILNFI